MPEAAAAGSSGTLTAMTGIGFRQIEAETGAESGTEKGKGTEGTGTWGETGIRTGSVSSSRIGTGTEEVTWAAMTGVAAGMTGTDRTHRVTAEGTERTGEVTGDGPGTQSSSRIAAQSSSKTVLATTQGSGGSSSIGVAEVAGVAGVHSSSGVRRSRRANLSGGSQVGAADRTRTVVSALILQQPILQQPGDVC